MDGFTHNPANLYYRLSGRNANESPNQLKINNNSYKLSDGDVLLVPSSEASDWSGVLNVSPMNGIDLGTDDSYALVSVRNDGTKARTIAFKILPSAYNPAGWGNLERSLLNWRDQMDSYTNGVWTAFGGNFTIQKNVPAGETWTIQLGLDRTQLPKNDPLGTLYGALLRFEDVDGGSYMQATIPFKATADGKSNDGRKWCTGLWVAEVAFNEVSAAPTQGKAGNYYEAGGVFKARLPFHVDVNGNAKLLQRVVFAGENDADGNFKYGIYAGSAELPKGVSKGLRISSICLPTELPVIAARETNLEKGEMSFAFVVDQKGATSILRHPYHPQHDGLRWDFETDAPSGDNIDNYVSTVKPELFSVTNSISLKIDNLSGVAWELNNKLSGTCEWELNGLRHEGPVKLRGVMSVQKISNETKLHQ